jgi:hypothetical protein
MGPSECAREGETLSVVLAGRWPDACDQELRSHVEVCSVCAQVAAVAAAFEADRDLARTAAVAPAADVWWAAKTRLRADAQAVASRPIVWTHAGAAAVVAGVALAYISRFSIYDAVGTEVMSIMAPPLLMASAAVILATPLAMIVAFRNS